MVAKLFSDPLGSHYQDVFGALQSFGLARFGKSNTENLLFQCRNNKTIIDVLAFR